MLDGGICWTRVAFRSTLWHGPTHTSASRGSLPLMRRPDGNISRRVRARRNGRDHVSRRPQAGTGAGLELPADRTAGGRCPCRRCTCISAPAISNARSTTPEFRPDAAIVPTNTGLIVTAASPTTQRVLIQRVQRQPQVFADLQDQIAARRKQAPAGAMVLQIGARLPSSPSCRGKGARAAARGRFRDWCA